MWSSILMQLLIANRFSKWITNNLVWILTLNKILSNKDNICKISSVSTSLIILKYSVLYFFFIFNHNKIIIRHWRESQKEIAGRKQIIANQIES